MDTVVYCNDNENDHVNYNHQIYLIHQNLNSTSDKCDLSSNASSELVLLKAVNQVVFSICHRDPRGTGHPQTQTRRRPQRRRAGGYEILRPALRNGLPPPTRHIQVPAHQPHLHWLPVGEAAGELQGQDGTRGRTEGGGERGGGQRGAGGESRIANGNLGALSVCLFLASCPSDSDLPLCYLEHVKLLQATACFKKKKRCHQGG